MDEGDYLRIGIGIGITGMASEIRTATCNEATGDVARKY